MLVFLRDKLAYRVLNSGNLVLIKSLQTAKTIFRRCHGRDWCLKY